MIEEFVRYLHQYRVAHETVGCRITHMFGVPMLVASLFVAFHDLLLAAQLASGGWFLQSYGHFRFEKNKPMLVEAFHIYTVLAALVFVTLEWLEVLNPRNWYESQD